MTHKKRLYRDTRNGKVAGVCAGLAEYLGWEVWVIRIMCVTALIFASSVTCIAYIVAWVVLDKQPKGLASVAASQTVREETRFERTVEGHTIEVKTRVWEAGKAPKEALQDIIQEFTDIEANLQDMERCVTSSKYRVSQEINRL